MMIASCFEVAIAGEDSFFVLQYNAAAVDSANPSDVGEDGVEEAFTVIGEKRLENNRP